MRYIQGMLRVLFEDCRVVNYLISSLCTVPVSLSYYFPFIAMVSCRKAPNSQLHVRKLASRSWDRPLKT